MEILKEMHFDSVIKGFSRKKNCTPHVEDINSFEVDPMVSSHFIMTSLENSPFFCIDPRGNSTLSVKFWHPLEYQRLLLYSLEFSIDTLVREFLWGGKPSLLNFNRFDKRKLKVIN